MRIAVSKHYTDSLIDIRERWSFADLIEAHQTLDALDDVDVIMRPPPPGRGTR